MSHSSFNDTLILNYLGLPRDYIPSPQITPIQFLSKHLRQLPSNLLYEFSSITTPLDRTTIPIIRNRRLGYVNSCPSELSLSSAKHKWPTLWNGPERRGFDEGQEEKEWAESSFMQGTKKHVGKLGGLLGGYEEEREAEKMRVLRRERAAYQHFVEEEDSDSEDGEPQSSIDNEEETPDEVQGSFERLIKERFIYGLLDSIDYNKVDWDDQFDDEDDREAEERWFDED